MSSPSRTARAPKRAPAKGKAPAERHAAHVYPPQMSRTPVCGLVGWCPLAHDHHPFTELWETLVMLGYDRDAQSQAVNLITKVWCKGHARLGISPDLLRCHDVQREAALKLEDAIRREGVLAAHLRACLKAIEGEQSDTHGLAEALFGREDSLGKET